MLEIQEKRCVRLWYVHSPPCVLSSSWRTSNSRSGLTRQPIIVFTSLTSMAFSLGLYLSHLSSWLCLFLAFPRTSLYKKSHIEKVHYFLSASRVLSALSLQNLHHMCSSASASAPSLQSAFLLCMFKLYLVLFFFQNSPTPWIMIPTCFCSFFSCYGLDSLPPYFRQNKLLVISLILRSHSLKRQNCSITIFSKKGKLSHIKCAQ